MSREAHYAAVQAAKHSIGELQERIAAATEAADEAIGVVANTTGGAESGSQSGQAATEKTARAKEILNDAYQTLTEVISDLDAYGEGW